MCQNYFYRKKIGGFKIDRKLEGLQGTCDFYIYLSMRVRLK